MSFSGVLKLNFGPFWFKTSILLVNVMPYGTRKATYILRVERPSVCGGRIELPIGHHGFSIDLLPRSAKDRRKLQFTIRYAKGKKLRFLAPTAEVYGHWISVLREAFEGNVKIAKRTRKQPASSTNETSVAISTSSDCSNSDVQRTFVINDNDSVREKRWSEQLNTSATTSDSCYQHSNNVTNVDNCGSVDDFEEAAAPRDAIPIAITENRMVNEVSDIHSDGYNSPRSSDELDSPITSSADSPPTVSTGQQYVFCMAIDHDGTAIFSVYVPPKKTRDGQTARREKLFNLSFVQWAQWMARELRDGDLPEAFRLTSDTCQRLQLNEILNIVQPYFA